jgi:hypothetical protein
VDRQRETFALGSVAERRVVERDWHGYAGKKKAASLGEAAWEAGGALCQPRAGTPPLRGCGMRPRRMARRRQVQRMFCNSIHSDAYVNGTAAFRWVARGSPEEGGWNGRNRARSREMIEKRG